MNEAAPNPSFQAMLKNLKAVDKHWTYAGKTFVWHNEVSVWGGMDRVRDQLLFLNSCDLKHKSVLCMPAGFGAVPIMAALSGAHAVATADAHAPALENCRTNALRHHVVVKRFLTDLFPDVSAHPFDYILVNAPEIRLYPLQPSDYASRCGEQLEYFTVLFQQAPAWLTASGNLILFFSQDFEMASISKIAGNQGFMMDNIQNIGQTQCVTYSFNFR